MLKTTKTASEWWRLLSKQFGTPESTGRIIEYKMLEQIRLEALKEGMEKAAEMLNYGIFVSTNKKIILAATEQLSVKDI
jgi:hypothetical protein